MGDRMLKSDNHSPLTNYMWSEFLECFKMLKDNDVKESIEHFLKNVKKFFCTKLKQQTS